MGKKGCIPGATQKLETESMIFGETSQGVGYSMALGKSLRVHPFGWFLTVHDQSISFFFGKSQDDVAPCLNQLIERKGCSCSTAGLTASF